jgi:GDP-4-dehydro-6-deoxy-D-mannose reductase
VRSLVTGAGGFVGAHLARHLEGCGDEVVALDRAHADVRDAAAMREAVAAASPDVVYHLAAQSSVAASFADPVATWETNVLGTVTLLEAVRASAPKARVLVAASADAYGHVDAGDLPLEESAPLRPANPYAGSKAAQETAALQYHRGFGVDAVVVRGFNAIGPGQSPAFALPGFARQLALIARGEIEPALRVGNLGAERDLTDVRDAVRAYRLLAERGEPGGVYNVCSGTAVSIRRALEMLVQASGLTVRVEVDPAKLRPVDIPRLVGSNARLRAATGWQPEIPLEQTLADVLEDFGS